MGSVPPHSPPRPRLASSSPSGGEGVPQGGEPPGAGPHSTQPPPPRCCSPSSILPTEGRGYRRCPRGTPSGGHRGPRRPLTGPRAAPSQALGRPPLPKPRGKGGEESAQVPPPTCSACPPRPRRLLAAGSGPHRPRNPPASSPRPARSPQPGRRRHLEFPPPLAPPLPPPRAHAHTAQARPRTPPRAVLRLSLSLHGAVSFRRGKGRALSAAATPPQPATRARKGRRGTRPPPAPPPPRLGRREAVRGEKNSPQAPPPPPRRRDPRRRLAPPPLGQRRSRGFLCTFKGAQRACAARPPGRGVGGRSAGRGLSPSRGAELRGAPPPPRRPAPARLRSRSCPTQRHL